MRHSGLAMLWRVGNGVLVLMAFAAGIFILASVSKQEHKAFDVAALIGDWRAKSNGRLIHLALQKNMDCTLRIEEADGTPKYYIGKCHVDANKYPVAFTINQMMAHDFNLYAIAELVDRDHIFLSDFAKIKKARPMTFEGGFVMVRDK